MYFYRCGMAKEALTLEGQAFGRWLVLARAPRKNSKSTYWRCSCSCGQEREVRGSALTAGTTSSCGCFRQETSSARSTTHGKTNTSLYHIWCGIKARCLKPTDPAYKNYGGRGITLCQRWLSFERFASDVGPRPDCKAHLDRINNEKGYSPSNCRWSTPKDNSRNRRGNVLVLYQGRRMTVMEASELSGIPHARLYARVQRNCPASKLFTKGKL